MSHDFTQETDRLPSSNPVPLDHEQLLPPLSRSFLLVVALSLTNMNTLLKPQRLLSHLC